jgi:hypothetical protein
LALQLARREVYGVDKEGKDNVEEIDKPVPAGKRKLERGHFSQLQ